MTLETKTELLKYYVMTSRTNYNLYTYHSISLKCLEKFIDEIDADSFYVKKITDCGISAKRFVKLLDYFIMTTRESFFGKLFSFNTIENILNSNEELLNLYFHYKGEIPMFGSNSELNKIISRLLITNFIENSKCIDLINPLLNDNHIELKDIKEYSDKEVNKIVKLIDDIIFCQRTTNHYSSLFYNINESLKNSIDILKQRRKYKTNDKEYWNKYADKFIKRYYKDYEVLISNYNKRKECLKYF